MVGVAGSASAFGPPKQIVVEEPPIALIDAPIVASMRIVSANQVDITYTSPQAIDEVVTRTWTPPGGTWSNWQQVASTGTTSVTFDVAGGAWIDSFVSGPTSVSYVVETYLRIIQSATPRGDIKQKCRKASIASVGYPNGSSATVTLKSARKCAKYRTSVDNGSTFSKWKPVKSKDLTTPTLTTGTLGQMQVKAGNKKTTVYLSRPTQGDPPA